MQPSQHRIRVILIEDDSAIQFEIARLLSLFEDMELVAQGGDGDEAVSLCEREQPDVVLMDIAMPRMNGIEATRTIMNRRPETKIIAMTSYGDRSTVQEMLSAGAVGYVLKEIHPEELATIIRMIYSGKSVLSKEVLKSALEAKSTVQSQPQDYGLTQREIEIIQYMANGASNPEIAEALTISQATVKFHVSNILRKLGVSSRSAAIILASKQGLVD